MYDTLLLSPISAVLSDFKTFKVDEHISTAWYLAAGRDHETIIVLSHLSGSG